ncbi:potassium channel family protein [Plantactinospora sp. GCM10030261]|uniref:potassium channel family protein n=1 Tax=Plantactinospora sp. GCM10030261 TaxID=3273420 RepID=UPI00361F702A
MAHNRRRHAALACLLIVGAYFVVPVEPDVSLTRTVLRAVITALLVFAVAVLTTRQVRRQVRSGPETDASLLSLAVTLVAGLMTFALADYVLVVSDPSQFVGLRTRLDALYFALATVTTIGYGDVSAVGQLARGVVIVQMVFSVGVIATGISVVFRRASAHRGK